MERLGDDSATRCVKQLSYTWKIRPPFPCGVRGHRARSADAPRDRCLLRKQWSSRSSWDIHGASKLPGRSLSKWRGGWEWNRRDARGTRRDSNGELAGDPERNSKNLRRMRATAAASHSPGHSSYMDRVTRKYSVWRTGECWLRGSLPKHWKFLDSLLREGSSRFVARCSSMDVRKLLEAQESPVGVQGCGSCQPASHAGQKRLEKQCSTSRKVPRTQSHHGIAALYEADSRLKSGGTSQRAVMEFLVARLASSAPSNICRDEMKTPGSGFHRTAFRVTSPEENARQYVVPVLPASGSTGYDLQNLRVFPYFRNFASKI